MIILFLPKENRGVLVYKNMAFIISDMKEFIKFVIKGD